MPPGVSALLGRIPRPVRHEIPRPELLRQIGAHEGNLVALVAPGGYGKTTLLAQHARQHEGRVIWLTLSEDDADPVRLAGHLAAGLERLMPTLSLTNWRSRHATGSAAEGLASALAHDLNASTTNFEFVLDGAELLHTSAESWLMRWLGELNEGHRLLMAGRSEPSIGLARRVASGDAVLIGLEALAFTAPETAACLSELPLSTEALQAHAHAVQAQVEGWPVAVALVGSGAAPQLTPADLIRDVLGHLSAALLETLPEASVLDVWSEEAALQAGIALPGGWLREVRQAGLPLIPLGGSYRPHQLLREVLGSALRRRPGRCRALHLQMGQQAQEAGDSLRALHAYLAAEEKERALVLAATLTENYENRWEYRLVRQVLELFPEHHLPPDLRRLLGHALLETGEAARGEQMLYRLRQAGHRSPGLLRSLAVLASRAGQVGEFLACVEEGLLISQNANDQHRLLLLKAHALRHADRVRESLEVSLHLRKSTKEAGDLVNYAASLSSVHSSYYRLGQKEKCEPCLWEALEIYNKLGMINRMALLQNNLANLLCEQGRASEALELLDAALPRATQEQDSDWPLLLDTQGDAYVCEARYAEALKSYQASFEASEKLKITISSLRILPKLIEVALQIERPDVVDAVLAWISPGLLVQVSYASTIREYGLGLLARHQNGWPAVYRHFAAARESARILDTAFSHRAALYFAQAEQQLGLFFAEQAAALDLRLADAHDYQFLPSNAALIRELLALCTSRQWPSSSLQRLVQSPPTASQQPPVPAAPRLAVRTLGQARVLLADVPVHIPLSKSMEVLVWLACNGAGTRDQIIEDVWNGSNEHRHIEYFKVAVRHLRLALASHPAVRFNPLPFEQGVYRLSERFTLEIDVLQTRQALHLPTLSGLQDTLSRYGGPFLPTAASTWADTVRLDVLETTLAAALTLGALLEVSSPEQAVLVYERAIALEPLQEESYVRLLRLHRTRGDEASAQRTYRHYRRMLAEEFGRAPTEEFVQVYERL